MDRVAVGDVELCYDVLGDPAGDPLLLVHGLGGQLISWDEGFCDLVGDEGFRVIRYDHRDAGKSTIFDEAPRFRPGAPWSENRDAASYTLDDMADDGIGLLAALSLDAAHVVGVSMGGMIAQTMAIRHADKVESLCSIMSTTGAPGVGGPTDAALKVLIQAPAKDRQAYIDTELANHLVIGSRGALVDEEWRAARYARFFDRGLQPRGTGRNLMAIVASGDRTEALAGVRAPTVVIHGAVDTLIDVSGGRATAAAIPGADLLVIADMGHELPPAVWPEVVAAIARNARRAMAPTTTQEGTG